MEFNRNMTVIAEGALWLFFTRFSQTIQTFSNDYLTTDFPTVECEVFSCLVGRESIPL